MQLQKAVWFAFAMATILLVGAILYSSTVYLGIFKAVRTLEMSISDFDFRILDSTKAVAETVVSLNNSSPHEFHVLHITERVYVNDMFVGTVRLGSTGTYVSIYVPPDSIKNATMTLELDLIYLLDQLVEVLLEPSSQKDWTLFIDASVEGPLVGKFTVRTVGGVDAS